MQIAGCSFDQHPGEPEARVHVQRSKGLVLFEPPGKILLDDIARGWSTLASNRLNKGFAGNWRTAQPFQEGCAQ